MHAYWIFAVHYRISSTFMFCSNPKNKIKIQMYHLKQSQVPSIRSTWFNSLVFEIDKLEKLGNEKLKL